MNKSYVKNACKVLTPIYVPGEKYSFYLNLDKPTTDPNFDNFKLCIYDLHNNRILTDIGLLQRDIITGILYNIFSVFEMPALADGEYCFVIWDSVNDVVKCNTNKFLLSNTGYADNTSLVVYRNTRNLKNIDYENLIDFYQVFRLPFIKIDYQYDVERTQYRNVSNKRQLRNLLSFLDKEVKIESYFFDEDAHDATALLYQHDEIYFDGTQYEPKDAYQIITDELNNAPKGSINCYVVDSDTLFVFDPNLRSVTDNYDYLKAYFGDPRITRNGDDQFVFSDQRLIDKVGYGIYASQIPGFIFEDSVIYDGPGGKFTITIPDFALVGTGKLYIFYNIAASDMIITF